MKFFVVVGIGPNDLEIPLVPFVSKDEAEAFITKFPHTKEGWLEDDFVEVSGVFGDDEDDEGQSSIGKPLYTALFKEGRYYSGCGGVYNLRVLEVEMGSPMVGWDLD